MASKQQQQATGKDPDVWWRRTRICVALLGLTIAAVNCYAQATFCIAIVEMVLPADFTPPSNQTRLKDSPPKLPPLDHHYHHQPSNQLSCPIVYEYRDYYDEWRLIGLSNNLTATTTAEARTTTKTVDVSNRFDWDASQQGLLLGAFALGMAPLQIFGGRLAEIYGAKWVLFASCLGTAITNLTIPYLAHFSFVLLLINRIIMGVAQAGMEPGVMCLLADWLTPTETSFFISMELFAICTGYFLGSLWSSLILSAGYGWPLAYYVSGGLNLLIAILWLIFADSWPQFSKYISSDELDFIASEKQLGRDTLSTSQLSSKSASSTITTTTTTTATTTTTTAAKKANDLIKNAAHIPSPLKGSSQVSSTISQISSSPIKTQAPWRNILRTRAVWAFIICKFSIRWCVDVVGIELPTYLANVLHLSIELNGILNSISSALFAIASFIIGWSVNEIIIRKNPNKTKLRKYFQSVASFGSALSVFLMTRYDCNIVFSMSMLLVLSCCLVMGTGGEIQIPYDMTSKYPGTLHGMACTLSVSGWLAPPLIGLILGDQPSSRYRWSIVWYSTASITLIGGLIFLLFADSSPRDFDDDDDEYAKNVNADKRQQQHRVSTSSSSDSSNSTTSSINMLEANNDLEPIGGRFYYASNLDSPLVSCGFVNSYRDKKQQAVDEERTITHL